jgi:hypothetical protein
LRDSQAVTYNDLTIKQLKEFPMPYQPVRRTAKHLHNFGQCHGPFSSSRRDAKYCSDRCRKIASRQGIRRAEAEQLLQQYYGQLADPYKDIFNSAINKAPVAREIFIDLIEGKMSEKGFNKILGLLWWLDS